MPIFEYKCDQCGHIMEVIAKAEDKKQKRCPQCGKNEMKKHYSSFGVTKVKTLSGGSCPTGTCPYSS